MENFIFCAVMVGHKEEKQAKNQQNFPAQLHIFPAQLHNCFESSKR